MPRKRTKAYSPEIYKKIDSFRLFDDTFMSKVFDGQKEETALLLQIILDDSAIKVISVHAQVEIKNLQGRSVRLDIKARNSKGVIFAVEVQRADSGAIPKRARQISSLIDANSLKASQDFDKLPETYVIFITEHDVLKKGEPIYHIDRVIRETDELFGDMEHIIYVNGEIDDDTELGLLMRDFHCTQAKDMHFSLLAKRVKYFKETQRGRDAMCAIVEQYADEKVREEVLRANRQALLKGFRSGLTKKMAKTMYPKVKDTDIDELYQEAKKPTRSRRPVKRS
ncbi:MAG: Rpn family recombination-promoting nuclease/putative transposase [Lachnospiraceae bacterium]|nr:Rpn family recombination-promoting nuclease/putative transposase [Lachnospiraceae bacterium]